MEAECEGTDGDEVKVIGKKGEESEREVGEGVDQMGCYTLGLSQCHAPRLSFRFHPMCTTGPSYRLPDLSAYAAISILSSYVCYFLICTILS